jgi:hypothetical protein
MLKVSKVDANRVDIELSGILDSDTMRAGLDDLIKYSDGVVDGRMLYRITDFSMPTLGAFGVEFTRLPQLFGLIRKYDRCAVLCDTEWVRKIAEIEGALFPGLEIQAFDLKDSIAAEAWLAGKP